MIGLEGMTSAFDIGLVEDEHCHEILPFGQSPLLAKDTAAASTNDNTPASLKMQPALSHQQEGPNMIQKSSKCIIFDAPYKRNLGSDQLLR